MLLLLACAPDGLAFRRLAPELVADTDEVSFPLTALDATSTTPLTVTNRGDAAVSVAVRVPSPFFADRDAITLGAGEATSVALHFHPQDYNPAEGTVLLGSLALPIAGTVNLDSDGDGEDAAEAGGADCDDRDGAVYPGATDTCYDGVDADCADDDDDDCDADGAPVGEDCDDADATVGPGADEGANGIDDDCDGLVDEGALTAGALVLSELHPSGASWLELCSAAEVDLPLGGVRIVTGAGSTVLGEGTLAPGTCAAVCDNEHDGCAFTAELQLAEIDSVRVEAGAVVVDAVAVTEAWAPVGTATWSLDPEAGDNNRPDAWCVSDGTPGSPNPPCP